MKIDVEFVSLTAKLYKNFISPNNKYAFHTITVKGDLPQMNNYSNNWESFFATGFRHMLAINIKRAGSRW